MARKRKKDEDIYRDPRDFEGRDDTYILKQVLDDVNESETALKPKFDKFRRYYQLYRSYISDAEKRTHGANLFIPYIFNIIETAVPRVINAMFASRPFLVYKPTRVFDVDSIEKAKKMTKLVDYQMHQVMKAILVIISIVKSVFIYGTAVSKQSWRLDERNIVRRKTMDVYNEETEEMEEQVVPVLTREIKYDAPVIIDIPLEDFFFYPYATDIDDSPFCAYRRWIPLHELMAGQKEGIYKNIDKIKGTSTEGNKSDADYRLESIGQESRPGRKDIEVIEYWTNDWKVMIAEKNQVIQCIENPYWHRQKPFTKWVHVPAPGEFYGIGVCEVCESLQEELNTTRNQRIDNVSFVLNRMWKILRNANIDVEQLVSRPNGYIEVEDMNDIEELKFSDVTASAYHEEEVIKRDMDTTTGVHNYDRGAPTDRRETATTATIMSQSSSERVKLMVYVLEMGGLLECGRQLAELNRQFVDREIEFYITGDNGERVPEIVSPEDLDIDLDIEVAGSAVDPVANKEIRQNQLIQLLNIVQNNPNVNLNELLKQIFEAFDIKNIDNILTPVVQQELEPTVLEEGLPGQASEVGGADVEQLLGGMV